MRAASGWPATSAASGPAAGSSISNRRSSTQASLARKRVSAGRAFAGRVVPDEVAAPVHHHQLRVRQLPLEAVGAGHGGELVVLAPHEQDRHAELGEVVLLQLREVAGAVQLELAAAARPRPRTPSSTRRAPRRSCPRIDWRSTAREAGRGRSPRSSARPCAGSRSALAMPCHLPSGKKPVELITSALDRVRVLARPAQPDQAAPVVHHRHAALDPELARGSARATPCAAPRCRAGRAASRRSPRSPARSRASPASATAGITSVPHVRRLRVAVQQQRHRAVRRTAFAVGESGGEHLTLEHDGPGSRGQTAARRHGASERPARARADPLGRRGAHEERRAEGRVRPQARPRRRAPPSASRASAAW